MQIKQSKFLISVAPGGKLPEYTAPEIAIAGKSNVGKSSLINFLVNNKKMAKTSATPGRTRLLNYFEINNGEFNLVDLPGYGYAKASKSEMEKWGALIEGYFQNSENLKHVLVLVDSRHVPSQDDVQLVSYFFYYHIPFTIVATKTDKLSRQQIAKSRKVIAETFRIGTSDVIMTSAENRHGKEELLARIDRVLHPENVVLEYNEVKADD